MNRNFDCLVYVGRFQPLHNGHLAVLREALDAAHRVVVIVGSAERAPNIKHPFSDDAREAMLREALVDAFGAATASRVALCPLRDFYDDTRWVAAVRAAVAEAQPDAARIGIVGHDKDRSTYYLRAFPGWAWQACANHGGVNATDIRQAYFTGADMSALAHRLPAAVTNFLTAFRATPEFARLAEEFAAVASGKAAWSVAPYPPVFVTVDAVVRTASHVLMIKRGGTPGRGQWALPGGFLDQHERLETAALRELAEETRVGLGADELRARLTGNAVFDHPERSVRGRTITHAYCFDLGERAPPAVSADDDAADARWIPIVELRGMAREIFEDHLHIIDRFIPVW